MEDYPQNYAANQDYQFIDPDPGGQNNCSNYYRQKLYSLEHKQFGVLVMSLPITRKLYLINTSSLKAHNTITTQY